MRTESIMRVILVVDIESVTMNTSGLLNSEG